jgi:hypothetical protein
MAKEQPKLLFKIPTAKHSQKNVAWACYTTTMSCPQHIGDLTMP